MSLSKFESTVKQLPRSQREAYARLSDLSNFAFIKEKLNDPQAAEQISAAMKPEEIEKVKQYISSLNFTSDTLELSTAMGTIVFRIVEREEPKCIKLASEGSPIQLYLWLQLLPHGEADDESLLRVTIGAELNFFMKGMAEKPLSQAAEGLANMLASV